MGRELRSYLETPTAYIVAVLFIGIGDFLFFRSALLIGEASLAPYVDFLPWLLLFVVPAFTMGSVASERESGTYETLTTKPVVEGDVVLGKLAAVVAFMAGLLALAMLPLAYGLSLFGRLDWGIVGAGYLAALFLATLFAALGVCVSTFFTKQVSSLLATIAGAFAFIIIGLDFITQTMPLSLAAFLERVSAYAHMSAMARGVVDVRDLWYFVSVSAALLMVAHHRLLAARYAKAHPTLTRSRIGVALAVAIALVSNVLGAALPGRIDLTAEGTYTMSAPTKQILESLPDVVRITFYASSRIPASLKPVVRDTRDLLKEYVWYGGDNVVVSVKDPDHSPAYASEAEGNGIPAVQFNQLGQGQASLTQGYLGIVVVYAGKTRVLPFIERTSDLEYQLTSMIADLTRKDKKRVAFTTGHGEPTRGAEFTVLRDELKRLYDVTDLPLSSTTSRIASGTDVLILADPHEAFGVAERSALEAFLASGGSVFALVGGVAVDEQSLEATVQPEGLRTLFAGDGITIEPRIAYDLGKSEIISLTGSTGQRYLASYPFWARATTLSNNAVTQTAQSVLAPWSSTLSLGAAATGTTLVPLITTTPYAGEQGEPFTLAPNQELPKTDLGTRTLAAAVVGSEAQPRRIVVLAGGSFLRDPVLQREAGNLGFALDAVAWLAKDASIASIKVKGDSRRDLVLGSSGAATGLTYGPMVGSIALTLILGGVVYLRRRRLTRETYTTRPYGQ